MLNINQPNYFIFPKTNNDTSSGIHGISFGSKLLKFKMADADFIFGYKEKGNFHPAKIAQLLDEVNLSKNFRFPSPNMVTGPFLGSQSEGFLRD